MKYFLNVLYLWFIFVAVASFVIVIMNPKQVTYIICDVVEYYDTEEDTVLVCEMPNGELHEYCIIDAPEGDIDIACLKTENQDDYEMYKVVAVR